MDLALRLFSSLKLLPALRPLPVGKAHHQEASKEGRCGVVCTKEAMQSRLPYGADAGREADRDCPAW